MRNSDTLDTDLDTLDTDLDTVDDDTSECAWCVNRDLDPGRWDGRTCTNPACPGHEG